MAPVGQHSLLVGAGHAVRCAIQHRQTHSGLGINVQIRPGCFRAAVPAGTFCSENTGVHTVSHISAAVIDYTMDIKAIDAVILAVVCEFQLRITAVKPNNRPLIVGAFNSGTGGKQHRCICPTDGDSAGSYFFLHIRIRRHIGNVRISCIRQLSGFGCVSGFVFFCWFCGQCFQTGICGKYSREHSNHHKQNRQKSNDPLDRFLHRQISFHKNNPAF